eukprot:3311051-Rhodomonas_salina.2
MAVGGGLYQVYLAPHTTAEGELSPYAPATRHPVLTYRLVLSAYQMMHGYAEDTGIAHAMHYAVLRQRMLLYCDAECGTEIGYAEDTGDSYLWPFDPELQQRDQVHRP